MSVAVLFPVVVPPYLSKMKESGRAYAKIESREVFLRSVELYARRDQVVQRVVISTPDDLQVMQEKYSAHLAFGGVTVAGGTSDWFGCVARGLERLEESVEAVIVHDPCCPVVPFTLLDALEGALAGAKDAAGVVAVVASRSAFADLEGTVGGVVSEYVDMAKVFEVQSPQIFRRKALVDAYGKRKDGGGSYVDDAELVMGAGYKVITIPGTRLNQRMDSEEMVRLGKNLIEHLPKPKMKTPLNPFGEAEW